MIAKNEARKIAKENIFKMSAAEREQASGAIVDALISFNEFRNADSVFVFKNTAAEPETADLIDIAFSTHKTVSVPQTKNTDGNPIMSAVKINENTVFFIDNWGIFEPENGIKTEKIDLAVIPLVAFDGLNRIGHGKGYYDKFLSENHCFKLGVAFDCQNVKGLAVEPHDVSLDALITEKQIVYKDGTTVSNPYAD